MIIKAIIALFAIYKISSAVLGPGGQECGDPATTCPIADDGSFSSLGPLARIECGEGNLGCCTCEEIDCGGADSGDNQYCEAFEAIGDSSAAFVNPITITGDPDIGATAQCIGDSSCAFAHITGTAIKDMECEEDMSCLESTLNIECIADSCGIKCRGNGACTGSEITINNANKVECDGVDACARATIKVFDPTEAFIVDCKGERGCEGFILSITLTELSTITGFKGIICGTDACKDAQITIENNSENDIVIEELGCGSAGTCNGAEFVFKGDNAVTFKECDCGSGATGIFEGCVGATGIDQCMEGLEKLECEQDQCASVTITNPKEKFAINCDDDNACKGLEFIIVVNDDALVAITEFGGITCSGSSACEGATITIFNEQTSARITIEKVECEGDNACKGAMFLFEGNVEFASMKCDGTDVCADCKIGNSADPSTCSTFPPLSFAAKTNAEDSLFDDLNKESNSEGGVYDDVIVSFSKVTLIHLWGVVTLCLTSYVSAYWCYFRKGKKTVITV